MDKKIKVLWITNIPSPYRVEFFKELGKFVELEVLCETPSRAGRDESWGKFSPENFTISYLSEGADFRKILSHEADIRVITNYYSKAGLKLVAYMKLRKLPYIIEGDGAFPGSTGGIKAALKRWVFKDAGLFLSSADELDRYYMTYGVPYNKIVRYPFTSVRTGEVLEKPVSSEQKKALRRELGLEGEIVLVSVGQFIYRKGYDILFEALKTTDECIHCYIIGGEPTEEYLKLVKEAGIESRVHFVGFKLKDELNKYYEAADLFVLPTREDIWGLVINEAMAKGLPVITTDRCIAGLEMLTDETGLLVKAGDSRELARAVDKAVSGEWRPHMDRVLSRAGEYTIEKMSERHMEIFKDYVRK